MRYLRWPHTGLLLCPAASGRHSWTLQDKGLLGPEGRQRSISHAEAAKRMKIHEKPSRISCIMMAAIAADCLNEGLWLLLHSWWFLVGGGKCKDERKVNDEDSTFVVLVTVWGVSTSAARRPERTKNETKDMERVSHLRVVDVRLLMRVSPPTPQPTFPWHTYCTHQCINRSSESRSCTCATCLYFFCKAAELSCRNENISTRNQKCVSGCSLFTPRSHNIRGKASPKFSLNFAQNHLPPGTQTDDLIITGSLNKISVHYKNK